MEITLNPFAKKNPRSIAVVNKLSVLISKNSLRCLYFRFVYPHIIYSVEVRGKSNPTKLRRLRRLLDKCLKILSNSRINSPFIKLNLLNFDQAYEYFSLIQIYKYYVPGIGSYFKEKICDNQTTHNYTTRFASNKNLVLPLVHSSKIYNSFFLNALKLWNDLPVLIKNE